MHSWTDADSGFHESLENVARLLNEQGAPWMVFGGAAMALYGLEQGPVADIDIILPASAAARLCRNFAWQNHADGRSGRFRSQFLLRPNMGPVPVELLGGFCVATGGGWLEVSGDDGRACHVGSQLAFVPSLQRLAEIFRLCGREKDHRRAEKIERLAI